MIPEIRVRMVALVPLSAATSDRPDSVTFDRRDSAEYDSQDSASFDIRSSW